MPESTTDLEVEVIADKRERTSSSLSSTSTTSSTSSSSSPPPIKCLETRDSISSIDSDLSLTFDKTRKSCADTEKDEDEGAHMADLSDSASETGSNSGGKDSGCEVTPETSETMFTPPPDDIADKIVQQVEFYFSDANITKDAFLLKHVKRNKEGYVSLKLISSFKRVKHITKDWRVVAHALARSNKLQINEAGTKLRRLDPLPQYDETTPSRTVVANQLPIEKPTIENVAELFRTCGEIALIRILRPGNPIPADVRQFLNKNPSLAGSVCALVEFVSSESARNALQLPTEHPSLAVYELNNLPHPERKKKPQAKKARNNHHNVAANTMTTGGGLNHHHNSYNHHHHHHHQVPPSPYTGTTTDTDYSTCPSSSEAEDKMRCDPRMRMRRGSSNYPPKCTEPVAWLQRRLSASSTEANFMFVPRRLSYGRRDSAESASAFFIPRRLSNGAIAGVPANILPAAGLVACAMAAPATPLNVYAAAYNYTQRRVSSVSASSDYSNSGSSNPRSRSNSLAYPCDNVLRMPKGPDGSKGFRQQRASLGTIYS